MLQHIVKTPFDMKPNFSQCEKPKFNANTTDKNIRSQRVLELHRLSENIWFETPTAKEDNLVQKLIVLSNALIKSKYKTYFM